MKGAKIRLSEKEMELITNADWILTKNAILQKVNLLLSQVQQQQQNYLNQYPGAIPQELIHSSPKISKGENYQGLPYRVLDYPRYFNSSAVFAIRTMFWWGHYFSITLHLAGIFKTQYEEKIAAAWSELKTTGMYCCVNEGEWEHHFEKSNYLPVGELTEADFKKEIASRPFIKLAQKIPLQEWDDAENSLGRKFNLLVALLEDQLPSR